MAEANISPSTESSPEAQAAQAGLSLADISLEDKVTDQNERFEPLTPLREHSGSDIDQGSIKEHSYLRLHVEKDVSEVNIQPEPQLKFVPMPVVGVPVDMSTINTMNNTMNNTKSNLPKTPSGEQLSMEDKSAYYYIKRTSNNNTSNSGTQTDNEKAPLSPGYKVDFRSRSSPSAASLAQMSCSSHEGEINCSSMSEGENESGAGSPMNMMNNLNGSFTEGFVVDAISGAFKLNPAISS